VAENIPARAASSEPITMPVSPPDIDAIDAYVARVIEIISDVQPVHFHTLITQHIGTYKDGSVEQVLDTLFEDSSYPKIGKKGKRKREEIDGDERGLTKIKIDYEDKDRAHSSSRFYVDIALVWSTPVVLEDI
jgi:TRIAD3 protein (E3 ubiquitin-protein ligase RNF216)